MSKVEFISELSIRLARLPKDEVRERISFYCEMIDDRMEEGLTEAEAVAAIGTVDEVATQILSEIPFFKIAKERIRPKRKLGAWEIALIALGTPIWLALLISAFAVVISVYASIWAVVISLWAAEASIVIGGVAGVIGGIGVAVLLKPVTGLAFLAASLVLVGLSVFLSYGCKAVTNGMLLLTKKIALGIKKCFVGKGEA